MHISEALIDEATGGLIAPGTLELVDVSDVTVPTHEHVLLLFEGLALICRPITSLARLPNGLCRIEAPDIEIRLFAMGVERFDGIIPAGADPAQGAVSFSSDKAGIFFAAEVYDLQQYTLTQSACDKGLTVTVEAAISARARSATQLRGQVKLRARLNWATLTVRALRSASHFRKPETELDAPPVRLDGIAPAHWRLEDLRLAGEDVLTSGRITLAGLGPRSVAVASHVVAVRWLGPHGAWDRSSMSFRDCERAELRGDGFCTTFESEHWLDVLGIDFRSIEGLLRRATSARIGLEGAGLGHLFLDPGIPGAGHGGNRISQPLTAADISVGLTEEGLVFYLDGKLGPFEQRRLDQYARRGHPVSMEPYERVAVEVTVPWIWLLIYSPKLGARHVEFGVQ